ncbi:MAG TPA: orotidine-5'-phosphate decarboxylase [Thermomicrobiales bacterium]|jgi:orotidine-5'-phosphate decarboxylase
MVQSFAARIRATAERNKSLVCVGLDPNVERFPVALRERFTTDPAGAIVEFNHAIIDATADLACAYKPNLGFYMAYGLAGLEALVRTREAIPIDVPVILDAKVNDLGSTATAYAAGYFDAFGFDAVTFSPYMGGDSLAPFLTRPGRGVFILCRTSNPGARDLQDLSVGGEGGSAPRPLYEAVAGRIAAWEEQFDAAGTCGAVTGATYPREIAAIRALLPNAPLLIPGVGEQGGSVRDAVRAGIDAEGYGALINASRSLTYASSGADFATAARAATDTLREAINEARATVQATE